MVACEKIARRTIKAEVSVRVGRSCGLPVLAYVSKKVRGEDANNKVRVRTIKLEPVAKSVRE